MVGHLVQNSGYIIIAAVRFVSKIFAIAFICPLAALAGFPLICPDSLESRGTTLEADTEPADACEKFNDADVLVLFHFHSSSLYVIIISIYTLDKQYSIFDTKDQALLDNFAHRT